MTALPDALGAHLAVSFDLVAPLGEGGMGVVWLARDRLLDREVAIKVLRAETAEDPESARRFLQEARLAARLQHPGVVPLLTFGEVSGSRYYVMPYVRGETLADRIRRGPIPEAEVRRIVADVADALAYVHAQGIVHRDVKPANILLEAGSGRVVLADFGIARGTDGSTSLTATGMVVGTPLYLAPEQAMAGAEKVDGRADVYALGVVAWEALVGASPFAGATPQEVMARKMTGGIPNVRERVPAVSAPFADAIARAVAADPGARWADARGLAEALRAHGGGDEDSPRLRGVRAVASNWMLASPVGAALGYPLLGFIFSDESLFVRLVAPPVAGALAALAAGAVRIALMRSEHGADLSAAQLAALALRPPAWWPGWWPKRWRGQDLLAAVPQDVASALHYWNTSATFAFAPLGVCALLMILLLAGVNTSGPEEWEQLRANPAWRALGNSLPLLVAASMAGLTFLVHAQLRLARELRRLGFAFKDIKRHLIRPYDPASARVPEIARLIAIARNRPHPTTTAPSELPALLDDLGALAFELRQDGWLIDDLAAFASEAGAADARWAREMKQLALDADPGEGARLRERLDRIRVAPAARSGPQAEMAVLVERQLQLHEEALVRGGALQECRDRLRDGCALIWRQLRALRADQARRLDPAEVSGQVRALVADLTRLRDADASL